MIRRFVKGGLIFGKILYLNFAIIATVTAIFGIYAVRAANRLIKETDRESLLGRMNIVDVFISQEARESGSLEDFVERSGRVLLALPSHLGYRYSLLAGDGRMLFDTAAVKPAASTLRRRPELEMALRGERSAFVRRYSHSREREMLYLARKIDALPKEYGDVVLRLSTPGSKVKNFTRTETIHIVVFASFLVVTAFAFSIACSHKRIASLGKVIAGFEAFGRQDYSKRICVEESSDLAGLAESANEMASRIEKSVAELKRLEGVRKDFVANVAHELRTPITAISGFSEMIARGAAGEKTPHYGAIICRKAAQMNAIIADLLVLATLENDGAKERRFAEANLASLIRDAVESTAALAKDGKVSVEIECDEALSLVCIPGLLEQAISNLVSNAIKYGLADGAGTIRVCARPSGDGVAISVTDGGSGIPPEEQNRIFERFYRIDKGRSREMGGTGLGLSIVKHIAMAHGGTVYLGSVPGKGSTFTIQVPARAAARP